MSTIISQVNHVGEPCDYCEVEFEAGDVVLEEEGPEEYCLVCQVCANKHQDSGGDGWNRWAARHAGIDDDHDYSMNG